ncbi:MAG: DUF262 domain-containing protein [Gammaproteobacteria bacterium]|nr:DUF262 domain-containing protein [Gammaproteobacteria bacterium]MCY4339033.1 DUF262 domain-containing protein [Gammaproteobacteria bacterium]
MSRVYEGVRDTGDTIAKHEEISSKVSVSEYGLSADNPDAPEVTQDPDDDIELERESPASDDQLDITEPFNPEKIRVRTSNVLIEQLVKRIDHQEIDLAPDFQRKSGIWNDQSKSRLIESLLLRIPIPVFYVAADEEENWSMVDGVQRSSTIYDYAKGKFCLSKLEYLEKFNGYSHDELPRSMQRRVSETQLVVNIIEHGTPDEVKFNIFHRINTGGKPLNGQEIRHALYPGPARKFLKDLAASEEFIEATAGSMSSDRMNDRECILRFLAFYMEKWENYNTNDLNGFLIRTIMKINKMDGRQRNRLANEFSKAMTAAFGIFGNKAFRKIYNNNNRRLPINKGLFEVWSVKLAKCLPEEIEVLTGNCERIQEAFMDLLLEDWDFVNAISYSTSSPVQVKKRFKVIDTLVERFL